MPCPFLALIGGLPYSAGVMAPSFGHFPCRTCPSQLSHAPRVSLLRIAHDGDARRFVLYRVDSFERVLSPRYRTESRLSLWQPSRSSFDPRFNHSSSDASKPRAQLIDYAGLRLRAPKVNTACSYKTCAVQLSSKLSIDSHLLPPFTSALDQQSYNLLSQEAFLFISLSSTSLVPFTQHVTRVSTLIEQHRINEMNVASTIEIQINQDYLPHLEGFASD